MALIKDGYWQDAYWASRYWQEDYWPEYGYIAPPLPTAALGRIYPRRRKKPDLFEDKEFLALLTEFVEII